MNLSIPDIKSTTADLLPGLLLTSALALLVTNLQKLPGINIFSPLILAVSIGVSIRNTVGIRSIITTVFRSRPVFHRSSIVKD
jgi:hypothetical protein